MEFKARDRRLDGDTTLRQCQLVQLYLLEILDEICKKHGLKYYLDFGTLLGAMRHGGAIPWDDDLDVSLPEEDYKKFMAIASEELPRGVLLQTPQKNGGWFTGISRLRDCKSFYCEPWTNPQQPSGVFIDIYPLLHRKKLPMCVGRFLFSLRFSTYGNIIGNRIAQNYTILQVWHNAFMLLGWKCLDLLAVLVGNFVSLFVAKNCWTQPPGPTMRYREFLESDIFPLRSINYEGHQFSAPNRPDVLLKAYYGDWRKLPPKEERNPDKKLKLILPDRAPKMWWAEGVE